MARWCQSTWYRGMQENTPLNRAIKKRFPDDFLIERPEYFSMRYGDSYLKKTACAPTLNTIVMIQ